MGFYTDKLIELSKLTNVEKQIDPNLYRPIDIQYQWGDISELLAITDWKQTYTIEQTLEDLLNYWVNKIKK
jgi:GDP-D-mannose dehydratase